MNASTEHQESVLEAFDRVVGPFLRKKLGGEIATLLTEAVQSVELQNDASDEEVFSQLCKELLETRFTGYEGPFLHLILNKEELTSLPDLFSREYKTLYGNNRDALSAVNAFDRLLAPDFIDVMGEELVDYLKQLYNDAIELQVGVADHVRFFVAMDKLMEAAPMLNEVEYVERIGEIAETLKHQTQLESDIDESASRITFTDGINKIIIPDLADVLGHGPVMKALIESTIRECSGVFPDEQAKFTRFVRELNKTDIILNMFGDHWTAGKEREWVEAFKEMITE